MPIPKRDKGEEAKQFMSRCMSSDTMNNEYPDSDQRTAVCISQSRAGADKSNMGKLVVEELVYADYEAECDCGNTEELSEANFVVPEEADYYEGYEDEVEEVSARRKSEKERTISLQRKATRIDQTLTLGKRLSLMTLVLWKNTSLSLRKQQKRRQKRLG